MSNNIVSKQHYQEDFEMCLLYANCGLILYLLIQTIMYQIYTKNKKYTNTYFNDPNYMLYTLGSATASGLIAVFTTAYVLGSRSIMSLYILLVVFLILFLYDIFRETAGVNTWLASADIANGLGNYATLNGVSQSDSTTQKDVAIQNAQYNIFEHSAFYSFSIMTGIILLYLCCGMISASYQGYTSGENNIYDSTFWKGMNPALGFFLESLFLLANASIPIVSAKIRSEPITTSVIVNSAAFGLGCVILNIMFQYCGFYNTKLEIDIK